MIKTEKKYWVNAYQVRGGGKHKTFTISILNIGIMFILYKNIPSIEFYKLTK